MNELKPFKLLEMENARKYIYESRAGKFWKNYKPSLEV